MKNTRFILNAFLSVVLITQVLLFLNSCKPAQLSDLQVDIDRIADRWVPDKREGINTISYAEGKDRALILKGETDCPELKKEIIDSLKSEGYLVIDSISVLPGNDLGEYKYGVVTLSVINLRRTPGHSSELVSQAILGTPVKVLKNNGSWLLIQTPDRYIAWTEKSSLKLMSEQELNNWKDSLKLIYIENSGWIYESPDGKGVIGDLVAGCILKIADKSLRYTKVELPDGREGYVRNNETAEFDKWKNGKSSGNDNIIKVASTMMGLPYLWGGSSTKAVDCSGFTQSVYFLNGIILSRDASLQALHGLNIDITGGWSKLQTGDLLFFGSLRNAKPRVTHVAIYKGDSEYIHSAGRVQINSLDSTRSNFSAYRKNSLLSARRIIGSEGSPGITAVNNHQWY